MSTDRIEKQVLLHAPRQRVWQAISDSAQFGYWFGVDFDGPFVAGASITGRIVPSKADPEMGKMQQPYAGTPFEWLVEQVEPMQRMVFRWHPYGVDQSVDYSQEPMTRIVFELKDAADGVLLTVTESGFDRLPPERRAKAFAANEGGWTWQMGAIRKYLEQAH